MHNTIPSFVLRPASGNRCDGFSGARTGTVYFRYDGTPAAGLSVLNYPRLPEALIGSPYSQQLDAFGGTGPYFWSIAEGQLPSGLALSPIGKIEGTPTVPGNHVFTAQVTDTSPAIGLPTQAATARLELNVSETPPALSITSAAPPQFSFFSYADTTRTSTRSLVLLW